VGTYCKHLADRFLRERDTLRRKLPPQDAPVDNRTSDMCVWLYIAFDELLKYARQVKAMGEDTLEIYRKESFGVFQSVMEQQSERVSDMDDARRFFKGLQVLLDTGEVRIAALKARNNGYAVENSQQPVVGFYKGGHVYLKNNIAFQQVVSYYRRLGKEFALGENALRKSLSGRDCILQSSPKSYIHRLSVNRKTFQCIKFETNKFKELLSGGKDRGQENDAESPTDRAVRKNADDLIGRCV